MGIAETNVNWGKVRSKDTLWDQTKSWAENQRLGVSFNTRQTFIIPYQQGSTATIAFNHIAHRYKQSGFDASGLGCWSWIVVSGTQNRVTRFVTVYVPQKNNKGINTVYSQQLAHLRQDSIPVFWRDLAWSITQWQQAGEQLVLMGDWNEDITGQSLSSWMDTFDLKEVITNIHGKNPPPTFHRGLQAIDGIFASSSLEIDRAGYLGFGDIPGDHRGIWIDVPHTSILGYKMSDIPVASARRLKFNNPRVVQRYLELLMGYLTSHTMFSRLRKLLQGVQEGQALTPTQIIEYEKLDSKWTKGVYYASTSKGRR